jgi:hypothetical protein
MIETHALESLREKSQNLDDHFDRSFSFIAMKGNLRNQEEKNHNRNKLGEGTLGPGLYPNVDVLGPGGNDSITSLRPVNVLSLADMITLPSGAIVDLDSVTSVKSATNQQGMYGVRIGLGGREELLFSNDARQFLANLHGAKNVKVDKLLKSIPEPPSAK